MNLKLKLNVEWLQPHYIAKMPFNNFKHVGTYL